MSDLLQELDSLPLLLFPESLSPLSLLEALTERVVVVVVDLQRVGAESRPAVMFTNTCTSAESLVFLMFSFFPGCVF